MTGGNALPSARQHESMTYTKTFALMDAWAEKTPSACLVRDTTCRQDVHEHHPMVNDPCAVEDCAEPLLIDQTIYAVTHLPMVDGHEQWVCWRHVRPDDGPVIARV